MSREKEYAHLRGLHLDGQQNLLHSLVVQEQYLEHFV